MELWVLETWLLVLKVTVSTIDIVIDIVIFNNVILEFPFIKIKQWHRKDF